MRQVPLLPSARQLLFSFRASGTPHPHPRVSYYPPSARQVPPIPIRASLSPFRASGTPHPHPHISYYPPSARQVCVRRSPLPVCASAVFEAAIRPAARQVPPLLRASVPPLLPSARQLLFSFRASGNPPSSSARQLLFSFRASGTPHPHPRVSYYPSARQVRPIPSARQLLSSLPRVRYASGAPHSRSARQPFSKLLFALPRVRYLPCFRASVSPLVSYYFPSAHEVTPILIRASATIPLPRVRYPRPPSARQLLSSLPRVRYASGAPHFRSARQPFSLPSCARQFHPYSHPLVSYYFPSAHQVTRILIRASVTIFLPRVRYPPPPSARQLLSPFRASGTPHPHPRVSYYPPFRASGMRQALPTPGPRVSLFRCYSPCRRVYPPSARQVPHPYLRVSYYPPLARVSSTPTPIRASATIFLPRVRYPPPPSARQLLSPFRTSGAPQQLLSPFRASDMRQALPTPGPRVSFFRSCYSPCRASGTFPLARQLLFSFRASGTPHPHPRVSYYPPSARQVPPIPSARQLLSSLPRVRYASGAPHSRSASAFFEAAVLPPLFRASVSPLVSYYFPSAHEVTPILIRASATIPLPRVRYPRPPSARQLLSSLPRVRYASGAPRSRSARQPFSQLPSCARQFHPYSSATIFLPRIR